MYRTHTCGELRAGNAGETVRLDGWLNNVRDKGSILFFTLRDHYGVTQAVVTDEAMIKTVRDIPRESTVRLEGKAVLRQDPNPDMPTGEIEIAPSRVEVLGRRTEPLPFEIDASAATREDLRLRYRYLDLRNPKVHQNIVFRAKVIQAVRDKMNAMGFLEIQTPILTSSSPEGARDFIVPSRLHPGKFYALPQAPQQFKQLLMLSGFDRYFQIAPCFRDEDARADRVPGEFYQLDIEMAFAGQEDVFAVLERLLYEIFTEFSDKRVAKPPFRRLSYEEAMERYGSDKPDLRNPLEIYDVTKVFENSGFRALAGMPSRALKAAGGADSPRKLFDRLTKEITDEGARGLVWLKAEAGGTLSGPAAKFLGEAETAGLLAATGAREGDAVFVIADEKAKARKLAGILRNKLGAEFGLIEQGVYEFCWIVDFPMYERDEETGRIDFGHNPFSMPQGGMEALKTMDPLDIKAFQYDITCNGIELSSGAERNYDPEIMAEAFRIAGYDREAVESRFPALYGAFRHGAPPHAGVAPGVDRILMLLADEPNIREVIAFPKDKQARDLLMGAPGEVYEKQLKEVNIKIGS
ncbi:MAG: aspartate--tRNA ligase [Firmicutes bacterium]|nr:aspartate--tRNA ligase [Bacillota bacterium]